MDNDLFDRLDVARCDPEAYWGRQAEKLTWHRRWDRVFEPDPPSYRWFADGLTNLGANAVDARATGPGADTTALVYRDERGGGTTLTYRELHRHVERALLTHPAVAEAGVVGSPDELRDEVICAFVVLKDGYEPTSGLPGALVAAVRQELGPVAVVGDVRFVSGLPKTRSGKIMRRVLKAVVLGVEPGDVTTIEDEGSVEETLRARQELVEQDIAE